MFAAPSHRPSAQKSAQSNSNGNQPSQAGLTVDPSIHAMGRHLSPTLSRTTDGTASDGTPSTPSTPSTVGAVVTPSTVDAVTSVTSVISVKPIAVPSTDRDTIGIPLHVKVTAPAHTPAAQRMPVLVFSHGNAWSMDGYEPLADRWAAAGFVVIQPTHLDSRRHWIGFTDPRFGHIWRVRISDLHAVLDHLPSILAQAGDLLARSDLHRIAVVGHSWGAQSAGTLLGARVLDANDAPGEDFTHHAVRAGVLIAVTGTGSTLTDFARQHLPFMRPGYSTLSAPTLVITGGKDQSAMSTRGPDWFTDAYHLSPGAEHLLTITDGEHTLGGLAGEAVAETSDEDHERVALVADATSAYLLKTLNGEAGAWEALVQHAPGSEGAFSITSKTTSS